MLNQEFLQSNIGQFLLSAKLGDGCYRQNGTRETSVYMTFVSYKDGYANFVNSFLNRYGFKTCPMRKVYSGYKKGSSGWAVTTRIHYTLCEISEMSKLEAIQNLNKFGLSFLYLDDGSLHKRRFCGHIYCNTFSDQEVEALIDKMYELYPIVRSSKRLDRKKDGRQYPYIYISTFTMKEFRKDVAKIIDQYGLHCFDYKVLQPSQTIEKTD